LLISRSRQPLQKAGAPAFATAALSRSRTERGMRPRQIGLQIEAITTSQASSSRRGTRTVLIVLAVGIGANSRLRTGASNRGPRAGEAIRATRARADLDPNAATDSVT